MTDTVERGVSKPRDLPDWLLSHGSAFTTTTEVARLLNVSPKEVAPIAARWRANKQAFSPSPGTYVPIPSQYRSWGAVPASHFVDPLMNHLGHPYYVGFLSAAEVHDAAHQRPQVFQIVTTGRLAGRTFGRVRLAFITSASTSNRPVIKPNTPTGTMRVSTPEVTVLDLVGDPVHGGGLSNVATVIGDLLEDDKLDIDQLVQPIAPRLISALRIRFACAAVVPDSPASRAGLRVTRKDREGRIVLGDSIAAIDGKAVKKANDLFALLEKYKVGDTVKLEVVRAEKRVEVEVALGAVE